MIYPIIYIKKTYNGGIELEREKKCHYLSLSGTAYECGRQLGTLLMENKALIHSMIEGFGEESKLSRDQLHRVYQLYDQFCPGTNEEIRGFAEAVGIQWEDVIYYFAYNKPKGCQCSQIAVTPEMTRDGHSYLARNYEFSWDDDIMLLETHVEGQFSHIGFGCQLFGRFDGMNEHGLCVATSAGVIRPEYNEEGFIFPVVVRAILNQCKTVDEAVELFKSMKFADFRNFLVIDRSGAAVLIEAAASKYHITRAGEGWSNKFLCATNHYVSEELRKKAYYTPIHSVSRYKIIEQRMHQEENDMNKEVLQNILSSEMPEGVCCHFYSSGMGTMWSIIFDPMKGRAEICFGTPDRNEWRSFELHPKNEKLSLKKEYIALLRDRPAPPSFWKHMSLEEM